MFQTHAAGAAARRGHARQALRVSTTRPSTAAGRSRASRTPARPRTPRGNSGGGGRACWAGARITGGASRCATARTTSSPTAAMVSGFDWPIDVRGRRAVLRQGRDADRRLRRRTRVWRTRPTRRAGCLLPPPKPRVGELLTQQRAKKLGIPVIADPSRSAHAATGLRAHSAEASSGTIRRRSAFSPKRCVSAPRASGRRRAVAAARSRRTTNRPRFICRPRWRPAISTSCRTRWRAK